MSFYQAIAAVCEGRAPENELAALLSPRAEAHLEEMAQKAHALTVQHFGRTVQLYTPLYLSDHCVNECVYCGFNLKNEIPRSRLEPDEVEQEALAIAPTGIRHILVLTGDSRRHSPPEYIRSCVKRLKPYFSSISVEIYALTSEEYAGLVFEGVDGLTLYQETYDEAVFDEVHRAGPKKDYRFRLDAPERAAREGMRSINLGILLGLCDWRRDAFLLGCHAKYLMDTFPAAEVSVSLPRLKAHAGEFKAPHPVSDRNLVQMIAALRIFLPRLGVTLSTREPSGLRDHLLPIGITRLSAGSSTRVGGHTSGQDHEPQFEIADTRSVAEVAAMLSKQGYQPVYKDWMHL